MIIKELGQNNAKKLLFLPGAFSEYSWYEPSLHLLSEKWHVFVVIYDGYHEPFNRSFTTVTDTAERLLDVFEKREITSFDLVYGLSMGGSIANLFYAYDRAKINTLIIDAGISPYQLPYFLTRLLLLRDTLGINLLRHSKKLVKMAFPPERWLYPWEDETSYEESLAFMQRLSRETIRNCFDSCNNYAMPKVLPTNDTTIHYLYGALEKKQRARDIAYFCKVYPQIAVKEYANRDHGELATIGYKTFVKVINDLASP